MKVTLHKGVKGRILRVGPMALVKDRGSALNPAGQVFDTHLAAAHIRDGKVINTRDLGSGLVTNAGVNRMAEDWFWANGSTTLEAELNMASGTGATAAAVGDTGLGTAISASAVAGAQSTVQPNILQVVGTISYTGTAAVTEWGLFDQATISGASNSTGTSTAVGTSSMTDSGKSWTTNQWAGYTVTTGSVMALVLSNTGTVLTIGSWRTPSTNALPSNPSTGTYAILSTMWDRKVFSAINVINGDSVSFTYQLSCTSGG